MSHLALEQRRKPKWSERRFGLQIALVQALCHCQLPRGSSVDFFIEDRKYACQLGERPNINVLSTSLGRSKRKQIIYHTRGGGTLWKSTQTHAPQISPRGASVAPWMSNACGNPIVKDLSCSLRRRRSCLDMGKLSAGESVASLQVLEITTETSVCLFA